MSIAALDKDTSKHATINRMADVYVKSALESAAKSAAADRRSYLGYVAAAMEQASETLRAISNRKGP